MAPKMSPNGSRFFSGASVSIVGEFIFPLKKWKHVWLLMPSAPPPLNHQTLIAVPPTDKSTCLFPEFMLVTITAIKTQSRLTYASMYCVLGYIGNLFKRYLWTLVLFYIIIILSVLSFNIWVNMSFSLYYHYCFNINFRILAKVGHWRETIK